MNLLILITTLVIKWHIYHPELEQRLAKPVWTVFCSAAHLHPEENLFL